ncbi:GH23920 [Drosophila grimshawi]|uniref:GH23920 n=1 Tax=Drosophila grimshawi TaxID=7222 RepID=B4K2Z2_DROGR|nr:GH23920 [Drosophila grimshawi]
MLENLKHLRRQRADNTALMPPRRSKGHASPPAVQPNSPTALPCLANKQLVCVWPLAIASRGHDDTTTGRQDDTKQPTACDHGQLPLPLLVSPKRPHGPNANNGHVQQL